MKPVNDKDQRIIDACHSHARDLVRSAKRVLNEENLPNVALHLAIIALEEIGKAHLVAMGAIQELNSDSTFSDKALDDHKKKLFWALWGPSFGRQLISNEQLDDYRGYASKLHSLRLKSLYIDPTNSEVPIADISHETASNIIKQADLLLELSRLTKFDDLSDEQQSLLMWFLDSTNIPDKRQMIFGQKSMEKLTELGDVRGWVKWLKDVFEENDAKNDLYTVVERKRVTIRDGEQKIKWKVKIRLFSPSHSIRAKEMAKWNKQVDTIKFYPIQNDKNQFQVELYFHESVAMDDLWHASLNAATHLILSLNIGTLGFFWWYQPKHENKFYESIEDVIQSMPVYVTMSGFKADWGTVAINELDWDRVGMVSYFLRSGVSDALPFHNYLRGLSYLGANSIHNVFIGHAFVEFYDALANGVLAFGPHHGGDSAEDVVARFFEETKNDDETLMALVRSVELIRSDIFLKKQTSIMNAEHVAKLKTACDWYFLTLASANPPP